MNRYLAIVMFAVAGISGCSTWNSIEATSLPKLPQTRMSRDSIGIQVATVTMDASNIHLLDEILETLDEQVMSVEKRRHLATNGFLGGILGTQLPAEIQLLLLESADRREHPTAESLAEAPDQQRFIQCRSKKRVGIELWGTAKSLSATHNDGAVAFKDLFEDATCRVSVRCQPARRDGAKVTLTPEIDHGPLRQRYVVDGDSFHMESRRERTTYEDLQMEFFLRPGEVMLVTCTDDPGLVGQSLFRNVVSTKQKLLLVRLAQTQIGLSFEDE